jgi:hypothetical protein
MDELEHRRDEDRLIRHQNVERYKRLLRRATDPGRREYILKLIAAEKQKQKDSGDSEYLY